MKQTKTAIIVVCIILSIMLLGCSSQQKLAAKPTNSKTTASTSTSDDRTPEEVLASEVADGKLVEVYDEYVRIAPGEIKKNWLIINNVKDDDEEFTITPCGGCDFENRVYEVPAGEYKVIMFKVRAMEGQKEIRVKDHLNNAYGFTQISVIVE